MNSNDLFTTAYTWLCKSRLRHPHNADVWDFRWRLRHAIKILNEEFELLGLKKHPQKTSIGRVEKGFEFLGYHYRRDGISVAGKTIDKFISKALRLYEQESVQTRFELLGGYTKRWVRWTTSGL